MLTETPSHLQIVYRITDLVPVPGKGNTHDLFVFIYTRIIATLKICAAITYNPANAYIVLISFVSMSADSRENTEDYRKNSKYWDMYV